MVLYAARKMSVLCSRIPSAYSPAYRIISQPAYLSLETSRLLRKSSQDLYVTLKSSTIKASADMFRCASQWGNMTYLVVAAIELCVATCLEQLHRPYS